jgi:hypothetical protein
MQWFEDLIRVLTVWRLFIYFYLYWNTFDLPTEDSASYYRVRLTLELLRDEEVVLLLDKQRQTLSWVRLLLGFEESTRKVGLRAGWEKGLLLNLGLQSWRWIRLFDWVDNLGF